MNVSEIYTSLRSRYVMHYIVSNIIWYAFYQWWI